MDLFVLQQERHGHTLSTLVINNRAQLRTCTQLQTHMHTHTHTHRTIRSGTYTTRFVKPHKMSKTCINNSKQQTLKEAMAMHTPNVFEAQLQTGVYSWAQNGCHSQFTSSKIHTHTLYTKCKSVVNTESKLIRK